jgi:hypothetical protein
VIIYHEVKRKDKFRTAAILLLYIPKITIATKLWFFECLLPYFRLILVLNQVPLLSLPPGMFAGLNYIYCIFKLFAPKIRLLRISLSFCNQSFEIDGIYMNLVYVSIRKCFIIFTCSHHCYFIFSSKNVKLFT